MRRRAPFFGVEDAVASSLVGMYAMLTLGVGGAAIDVPDLSDRAVRNSLPDRQEPALPSGSCTALSAASAPDPDEEARLAGR